MIVKTLPDGTEQIEGTPEEIAAYRKKLEENPKNEKKGRSGKKVLNEQELMKRLDELGQKLDQFKPYWVTYAPFHMYGCQCWQCVPYQPYKFWWGSEPNGFGGNTTKLQLGENLQMGDISSGDTLYVTSFRFCDELGAS